MRSFVEMFVGMGASKVRDLFKQAKEKAPCIVFIDEIDAIGQKRSGGQYGGNDEREQTLNQLLTEMDGFEGNTGVIILAATNRPESLDPALTRPGRFDRRVPVELPDLLGREAILKVHAKKIKIAEDVDFNKIARMASGASGAELANIVNEAALRAVRDGRRFATQADLEESIEVVIAGYQKKNAIMTDHEKHIVAYHEIGHALVAAKQTNSAPVQKITIVPRTSGALGYTMQVEEGNHYLMSQEEMENKIATLTGGRAAEETVFGTITTGASNDIEQATKLARAMITRYGMSRDFDMVAMETVAGQRRLRLHLPQKQEPGYPERHHYDGHRASVHRGRQLHRQPGALPHHGKLLRDHDVPAGRQVHRPSRYDHQGGHAGCLRQKACRPVCGLRHRHWLHLWLRGCGRRHDDAADPDHGAGL